MALLAYIGPGPGLVVQAPLLIVLLALGVGLLSLLTFPFRWIYRRLRYPRNPLKKRVVVLGLDGLEPTCLEALMKEGSLPNFSALKESGCYHRLGTTLPPLSPGAWSSFSTGVNPGKHGIFGFVQRDANYALRLTSATVEKKRPRFLRRSTSFWRILGQHGVFCQVLRVPISWPPEKFSGFLLSAMGAPDLLGTQGTYTLFSSELRELKHGTLKLLKGEPLSSTVDGPEGNALHLELEPEHVKVDGRLIPLEEGRFTEWVPLKFGRARGLVKFLKLGNNELYMTPIQIDPSFPSVPISQPYFFSTALAKACGAYATCGLAEDTGAREDEVLSEKAFLELSYSIHKEREEQFFHLLRRCKTGCLVGVFDGPDRIQHMFCGQGQEPSREQMYERMDELVGKVQRQLDQDTAFLVLSDHGFKPLHTLLDLNRWLANEGYLHLENGEIDWEQSRAYLYNLSGIRINLAGRENLGCVKKAEVEALTREIRERLLQLKLPETGQEVFKDILLTSEAYQGPYVDGAPELVLGFYPGFGLFKDSIKGDVSDQVFHPNASAWNGDHCFHPETVPGVLLANHELSDEPALWDLPATILTLLGVKVPDWMEGRSLLLNSTE